MKRNIRVALIRRHDPMTTRHGNQWFWESTLGNPTDSILFSHDDVKFACKLCDITEFMELDAAIMRRHCKKSYHTYALHNGGENTTGFWVFLGNTVHSIHVGDTVFMCTLCDNGVRYPNNLRAMHAHHSSEAHGRAKALAFADTIAPTQKRERQESEQAELRTLWEDELKNPKGSLEWIGQNFYYCRLCDGDDDVKELRKKMANAHGMIQHCESNIHRRNLSEQSRKRPREDYQPVASVVDKDKEEEEENRPAVTEEEEEQEEPPPTKRPSPPPLLPVPMEEDTPPAVAGGASSSQENVNEPPQSPAVEEEEQEANASASRTEAPPTSPPKAGWVRAMFLEACDRFLEGQRAQIAEKCAKALSK